MLLHEILAAAERDAPALISHHRVTTFDELDERSARLAGGLRDMAAPGDRIAVVADNHPGWIDCYYGVPRAGMVLTPLNQRLSPAELEAQLAAAGATAVIGQRHYLEPLTGLTRLDIDELPVGEPRTEPPHDPAWLLFTSGTTGQAKGVMLTHGSLDAAVRNTLAGRPVAPDDVYLFPFPLCHVAGYNVLVFHVAGRPVVLLPRFDAAAVTEATNRHAVTAMSLAPTMLLALLDHLDATGTDLPTLRSIGYGAAPIAPALLRRATDRLGVALSQGYGMTELSGNAVFDGRPGPLIQVRLADDGEILVRGPQVTSGYWNDAEATAAAFDIDGWFRTGDLGRWDDDGRLLIVDRKKDIVITGGENVASREVEDVLAEHPAVATSAVVGVPDERWGEAVTAVVVRKPGAAVTADELVAHVRSRLAGFKRPRHVLFVDALPVNAGGKVLKGEVRAAAAAEVLHRAAP